MKKCAIVLALGLAAGFCFGSDSRADERDWRWSPVGVGLAAPLQVPYMETDVYGLRLGGFFGCNHDVYGLDLGVAEMTSGSFVGAQFDLFSWTEGKFCGLQVSGLANVLNSKSVLAQAALVNVLWDDAIGLQLGCANCNAGFIGAQFGGAVNWNGTESYGLQVSVINANQDAFVGAAFGGLVNYSDRFQGFSCGFVNAAYEVTGCQLGVVNACDRIHGVQLGLINLICESKLLPVMVLANASF